MRCSIRAHMQKELNNFIDYTDIPPYNGTQVMTDISQTNVITWMRGKRTIVCTIVVHII